MMVLKRAVPLIVIVLSVAWLTSAAVMPADSPGEMQIHEFGRLPVVFQGRVKPFDSLARNSLTVISERQTFRDVEGHRQPAIKWLLDVISQSPAAEHHPVFRIENLELQSTLNLAPRKGYRYALAEFRDRIGVLEEQARQAAGLEVGQRDLYERKVMQLWERLHLYHRLAASHMVPDPADPQSAMVVMQRLDAVSAQGLPLTIPPDDDADNWRSLAMASLLDLAQKSRTTSVISFQKMLQAWRVNDAETFNAELAAYQARLADSPLPGTSKLGFEMFFNHFEPFYRTAVLYLGAFLLVCGSWLGWSRSLSRAAFALVVLGLLLHTAGLASRIYISGYPPVTTLYSSAIFIGWGAVILGLVIELIFRIGVGSLVASVAGFSTLLIAHFLGGDGDTFEMMRAVLDTRFWLATHVTAVTLGYTATFVAGLLGIVTIVRGVLTRSLNTDLRRQLDRMTYGTLCFALLFSFVGTVLGGLWADDSWGRFWGWDPKENGALMIVLWNALILHARWGGMARVRGTAALAVFGNIVTAWSWFGVNQLGVGLHSYGFTDSASFWLVVFVLSQLAIVGLGSLPAAWWRSSLAPRRSEKRESDSAQMSPKGPLSNLGSA